MNALSKTLHKFKSQFVIELWDIELNEGITRK